MGTSEGMLCDYTCMSSEAESPSLIAPRETRLSKWNHRRWNGESAGAVEVHSRDAITCASPQIPILDILHMFYRVFNYALQLPSPSPSPQLPFNYNFQRNLMVKQ